VSSQRSEKPDIPLPGAEFWHGGSMVASGGGTGFAANDHATCSAEQTPEWEGETKVGNEGFRLIDGLSPPVRLSSVVAIPRLCEASAPLEQENFTT
jgi:hypothetical protein